MPRANEHLRKSFRNYFKCNSTFCGICTAYLNSLWRFFWDKYGAPCAECRIVWFRQAHFHANSVKRLAASQFTCIFYIIVWDGRELKQAKNWNKLTSEPARARALECQRLNQRNEANYNWQLLSRARKEPFFFLLPLRFSVSLLHRYLFSGTQEPASKWNSLSLLWVLFAACSPTVVPNRATKISPQKIVTAKTVKKYINIKSNFQCNINCTKCTYARVRLCHGLAWTNVLPYSSVAFLFYFSAIGRGHSGICKQKMQYSWHPAIEMRTNAECHDEYYHRIRRSVRMQNRANKLENDLDLQKFEFQ